MNIKNIISKALFRERVERIEIITNNILEAYKRLPYSSSPEQLIESLSEVDSRYIDLLIRQIKDREQGPDSESEQVRISCVKESRSLYVWDVITQNIIELWNDYGFGSVVDITPVDKDAIPAWDEFWKAKRNSNILSDRKLFNLSTTVLQDGEFYLVFFISKTDGMATVRMIPTDQITELVKDPNDNLNIIYYKREFSNSSAMPSTIYYKDWQADDYDFEKITLPPDSIIADEVNNDSLSGTDVVMMQVAHRERKGRGWPLMTAGASWSRAYRDFLQDRAAVSKAVATYIDKLKVKGSNRTIDAIRSKLESSLVSSGYGTETNPVPTAGSSWIENDAIDRQRMPLSTGAGDAEKDGTPLLAQAALAGRIFPHYLGRGEAFRLATATAMEVPMQKAFNRYKLFWSSVWRDIVDIVLTAREMYGNVKYESHDATINTDSIIQMSLSDISNLNGMVKDSFQSDLLSKDEATAVTKKLIQVGMQSIGISNSSDLLPDEVDSEELGESAIDNYRTALNQGVYGLWSGQILYNDFVSNMITTIETRLRQAWASAMKEFGMLITDMNTDEQYELSNAIMEEMSHIEDFGEYVLAHNKAGGFKLSALNSKLDLWVNRYRDIYNQALAMAGKDQPLEWVLGPTEEHCEDCSYYAGKVKRASWWNDNQILPQSKSLACKGYRCLCELKTTNKPMTRGRVRAFRVKID
jgi:hypothetical protein